MFDGLKIKSVVKLTAAAAVHRYCGAVLRRPTRSRGAAATAFPAVNDCACRGDD